MLYEIRLMLDAVRADHRVEFSVDNTQISDRGDEINVRGCSDTG